MTARVQRGVCSSQKARYRNRNACLSAIDAWRYRWKRQFGQPCIPLYVYRCSECRGWHMTKIPQLSRKDTAA